MKTLRMADLFCGAGGTSSGALEVAKALGHSVDLVAINHWPVAVATHLANHPEARHLCTGIDEVDPRKVCPGGLDYLWASPECTHHSRARGGKPMSDQSRATAYCVPRWAEALRPHTIFVENVPEFQEWGPLGVDGKPMASRKGALFRAWVGMLEACGYRVDWRVLCAADFGAPTTRERLFVQAVRGRRKIVWPERTHAPAKEVAQGDLFAGAMQPWRPASDIIDWSLHGRWLDEMPGKEVNGGLPLSPKTLRRIHAGLAKYGLKSLLVQTAHSGDARFQALSSPLPTVCGNRGDSALVQPFIVEFRGTDESQVLSSAKSLGEPLSTITTSGKHHYLINPFLVPIDHTGGSSTPSNSIGEPLTTVTTEARHGLIEPFLIPQQSCGRPRGVSEPSPTIATAGAIALVSPFLVSYYGNGGAQDVRDPLDTVTTKDRFGLVMPSVVIEGKAYRVRLRWRMLQPHELAAGQSFPKGYQFTGTKTVQVKQIGNAVPPAIAAALMRASLMAESMKGVA